MRMFSKSVAVVAAGLALAMAACADDGESTAQSEDAVIGALDTLDHPEIGAFWIGGGLCTGTLIREDIVLTAAHCYGGQYNGTDTSALNWRFEITTADAVKHSFKVVRAQSLLKGSDFDGTQAWREQDIAILRLETNVPAEIAKPLSLATEWAKPGDLVANYGYGCTSRIAGENGRRPGTGTKRKREYGWTQALANGAGTQNVCPGDSGGPFFNVTTNSVMGTNSGYVGNNDKYGNVPKNVLGIEAVIEQLRLPLPPPPDTDAGAPQADAGAPTP